MEDFLEDPDDSEDPMDSEDSNGSEDSPPARLVYSLSDLMLLCVACGIFLGATRGLQALAGPLETSSRHGMIGVAMLLWPCPLAWLGVLRRGDSRQPAASLLSGMFLWRLCAALYGLVFVAALGIIVIPFATWGHGLIVAGFTVTLALLFALGAAAVMESGTSGLQRPYAHVVGCLLYFYLIACCPIAFVAAISLGTNP